MNPAIFIVTAAYGNHTVLALGGQQNLLPIIANAGADGVEIRRELLTESELLNLSALGTAIADHALRAIYSAPEALFTPDGSLNPLLGQLFAEARQLNAERLKLSLGHFSTNTDATALATLLSGTPTGLLVENDQTPCGRLAPLAHFFDYARQMQLPIKMTFDTGNWHWLGEPALTAAQQLAPWVEYIHIKSTQFSAGHWQAIAPAAGDSDLGQLLATLDRQAARAVEFPLQGEDLTAVTRHYVNQLKQE